jgi:hypothetical protein
MTLRANLRNDMANLRFKERDGPRRTITNGA